MRALISLFMMLLLTPEPAHAIKTAASFDLSWATALLTVSAAPVGSTGAPSTASLNSYTGLQLDYNVALFDYRTVTTLSFMQFGTSSMGASPITRIAMGASYHFFRINGQRVILDNQVEGKIWGVSPALELSLGLDRLSVDGKSSTQQKLQFTAGLIDAIPRILIEIPMSTNVLLMIRAGTYLTLSGSSAQYKIGLSGGVFNLGFKLTTL